MASSCYYGYVIYNQLSVFNMKKILSVLSLSLLLAACSTNGTVVNQQVGQAHMEHHNAQLSLDWAGVYQGLLPCADCEGIQTQLTLTDDGEYTLEQYYLKNNQKLHPSKISGQFSFDEQHPSLIRLDKNADNRVFFVGENFVEVRDSETGEKLSENLNYSLRKTE